jgi:Flp pilus assembly protein TadD
MPRSTQLLRCSRVRIHAGFTVLAVMVTMLTGCAVGKQAQSRSAEQSATVAGPSPAVQGSSVARLTDGREGFVIAETPHMEGDSRRDFERAVTLMNDQDFEKAIGLLEKVIAQSPGVTAPYIDIAMAYAHLDKPEQAEQNLKTALSLVPDHPVASNEYGLLLRKTGRFAEARSIYEKTLATFPEYLPARRNLGILCDLYLNDTACALEQYAIYSKAMPQDEEVKLWIADLRLRLGSK